MPQYFSSYRNKGQAARLFAGMDAGRAVRDICAEPGMPDLETLKHWRKTNKEFAAGYAAAMGRKQNRNTNPEG